MCQVQLVDLADVVNLHDCYVGEEGDKKSRDVQFIAPAVRRPWGRIEQTPKVGSVMTRSLSTTCLICLGACCRVHVA